MPMLMTGPDIPVQGESENLVSTIALCPTSISMAGLPERSDCGGEDLLPLASRQTMDSRNTAHACFIGTTMKTLGSFDIKVCKITSGS